jgi:hypothetical protein
VQHCPDGDGSDRDQQRLLQGVRVAGGAEAAVVWLNGSPAIRIDAATAFNAAVSVAVEDRRITRIYVVQTRRSWPGSTGSPHSRGPELALARQIDGSVRSFVAP